MTTRPANALRAAFGSIANRLMMARPAPCWMDYMRETR